MYTMDHSESIYGKSHRSTNDQYMNINMLKINWIKGQEWVGEKHKNVHYGKAWLCFGMSSRDTPH